LRDLRNVSQDKLQSILCSLRKHCSIPALPFSNLTKTLCKPLGNKLISNPATIGEKLKNRRIELGLLQKDVANMIGICEGSITLWENNRNEPSIIYYPKIIIFLGYVPFEVDTSTLGGQIKLYRYLHGLSQEELARKLEVNESTIFHYENNKHKPSPKTFKKLKSLTS
jgi:DNA-binding XRE family transcriptional regulator